MKGLVLAAGLGSRLPEYTHRIPKPLVPVAGRPCIEPILEWLAGNGITEVGINTHHLPQVLHDHLGDGSRYGVRLTWQHEEHLLEGIGTAKTFESWLGDETLLMVNGDIVFDFHLAPILATHERIGGPLTLAVTSILGPLKYPVLWDETGQLRGIRRTGLDDPRGKYLGEFTGLHLIEPELLRDWVPAGRPYHLTKDLAPELLATGMAVGCCLCEGLWADIGNIESLRRAEGMVGLGRAGR